MWIKSKTKRSEAQAKQKIQKRQESNVKAHIKHRHHRAEGESGIALLIALTAVTVLSLVVVDFSRQSTLHLNEGTYIRDEVRANILADTALDMTRACLDRKAWGMMGAAQSMMDLEKLCNMMLGIFIRGNLDLPVGGLSVPLEGIDGLKLHQGEVDEVEIKPEASYIGLVGLACPPPNLALIEEQQKQVQARQTRQAAPSYNPLNCPQRVATVRKLRSLFCDPSIAHVFETEQPDGQRYTRADVIGNLIDWVDPDDNRVSIDPYTWMIQEGAGEGEDSYYRDGNERYRSKDSMFDSVEELRLVKGISDELYFFLKDRVSVHASDKINMNTASAEVLAALMQAHTQRFQITESYACGEESQNADMGRDLFMRYARMIVDARTVLQFNKMMNGNFLGQLFRTPQAFISIAQDPMKMIMSSGMGQMIDPLMILMTRYQMTDLQYQFIQNDVQWQQMQQSLGTKDQLFRLTVNGKLGEMTRKITAVLKQDGTVVRTLYYREE